MKTELTRGMEKWNRINLERRREFYQKGYNINLLYITMAMAMAMMYVFIYMCVVSLQTSREEGKFKINRT